MYPTLYHLFKDIFGVDWIFLKPINSFGLMVAIAFLVAAYLFRKEIIKKENQGLLSTKVITETEGKGASIIELVINFLIGFLIGYKFIYPFYESAVLNDFQHYILSPEGSYIGGFTIAFAFVGYNYSSTEKTKLPEPREVEREIKPHEHIGTITFIALVFGFLGAKLFAWLENPVSFVAFFQDPFSGLTIYGGLISASIACIIYIRKNNLHVFHFLDAVSPALILAYGIGRLGCHISGDGDWGIENTISKPNWMSFLPNWLWSYDYPNNVINEGLKIQDCIYTDYCYKLATPVFPTSIYEFLMCLGIFAVLMFLIKKVKVVGAIFFSYLFFNGVERFLIELIRVNETYSLGGIEFTQAQIISSLFIFAGIIGLFSLKKHLYKRNN